MAADTYLTAEIQLRLDKNASQVLARLRESVNNAVLIPTNQATTAWGQYTENLKKGVAANKDFVRSTKEKEQALQQTTREITKTNSALYEFGHLSGLALRRYTGFVLATSLAFGALRAMKSAIDDAIEFERQMIKVAQVSETTLASIASMGREISKIASQWGVSSKSLAEVAVTISQAGFSASETKSMLEALGKTTLAATFGDIKKTTEGVIAILNQFNMGASQTEVVLGKINAVAAAYAVEADDLIEGVKRGGAAFSSAGGDLDEFLALFTSVRQTTREGAESIGTGMRTIFTRLQRSSTIDMLKDLGIELRNVKGEFVGPMEAIRKINEGLKGVSTRSGLYTDILEQVGGYRQMSKTIPLFQQLVIAEEALRTSRQGGATLTRDAIQAQESLANQIARVREQFLALFRSIADDKAFKYLIDTILHLVGALVDLGNALKPIMLPLMMFGALKFAGFVRHGGIREITQGIGAAFVPKGKSAGGYISSGSGTIDDVPALLTKGEYVINKKAVATLGIGALNKINAYAEGGLVIPGRHYYAKDTSGYVVPSLAGGTGGFTVPSLASNWQERASTALVPVVKSSEQYFQYMTNLVGELPKLQAVITKAVVETDLYINALGRASKEMVSTPGRGWSQKYPSPPNLYEEVLNKQIMAASVNPMKSAGFFSLMGTISTYGSPDLYGGQPSPYSSQAVPGRRVTEPFTKLPSPPSLPSPFIIPRFETPTSKQMLLPGFGGVEPSYKQQSLFGTESKVLLSKTGIPIDEDTIMLGAKGPTGRLGSYGRPWAGIKNLLSKIKGMSGSPMGMMAGMMGANWVSEQGATHKSGLLSAIGGGMSGAMTGAMVGNMIAPGGSGAVIGAVILGLTSLTKAISDTVNNLRKEELRGAIKEYSETIQRLTKTGRTDLADRQRVKLAGALLQQSEEDIKTRAVKISQNIVAKKQNPEQVFGLPMNKILDKTFTEDLLRENISGGGAVAGMLVKEKSGSRLNLAKREGALMSIEEQLRSSGMQKELGIQDVKNRVIAGEKIGPDALKLLGMGQVNIKELSDKGILKETSTAKKMNEILNDAWLEWGKKRAEELQDTMIDPGEFGKIMPALVEGISGMAEIISYQTKKFQAVSSTRNAMVTSFTGGKANIQASDMDITALQNVRASGGADYTGAVQNILSPYKSFLTAGTKGESQYNEIVKRAEQYSIVAQGLPAILSTAKGAKGGQEVAGLPTNIGKMMDEAFGKSAPNVVAGVKRELNKNLFPKGTAEHTDVEKIDPLKATMEAVGAASAELNEKLIEFGKSSKENADIVLRLKDQMYELGKSFASANINASNIRWGGQRETAQQMFQRGELSTPFRTGIARQADTFAMSRLYGGAIPEDFGRAGIDLQQRFAQVNKMPGGLEKDLALQKVSQDTEKYRSVLDYVISGTQELAEAQKDLSRVLQAEEQVRGMNMRYLTAGPGARIRMEREMRQGLNYLAVGVDKLPWYQQAKAFQTLQNLPADYKIDYGGRTKTETGEDITAGMMLKQLSGTKGPYSINNIAGGKQAQETYDKAQGEREKFAQILASQLGQIMTMAQQQGNEAKAKMDNEIATSMSESSTRFLQAAQAFENAVRTFKEPTKQEAPGEAPVGAGASVTHNGQIIVHHIGNPGGDRTVENQLARLYPGNLDIPSQMGLQNA